MRMQQKRDDRMGWSGAVEKGGAALRPSDMVSSELRDGTEARKGTMGVDLVGYQRSEWQLWLDLMRR